MGLYDRGYMRADEDDDRVARFERGQRPRTPLATWKRIVAAVLVLALVAGAVVALL